MKIGFIGIGQAGNNIAEESEKNGFYSVGINTAEEDLDSLELVRERLVIGDLGGCAKDRNKAIEIIKKEYGKILDFIQDKFRDFGKNDLIFVSFSTGGGTGSGVGPILLNLLINKFNGSNPDIKNSLKKFGALVILPSKNEVLASQVNTISCLEQLVKLEVPTIFVDNEQMVDKTLTKSELYEKVNYTIMSSLKLITNEYKSKYGNLDKADLRDLLHTSGSLIIQPFSYNDADLETIGYNKLALNVIDNESVYAGIEYDKVVKKIGVIRTYKGEVRNIDYNPLYKEIGEPLKLVEGYYQESKAAMSILILAGMTYPNRRIKAIKDIIESKKDTINIENNNENILLASSSSMAWANDIFKNIDTPSTTYTNEKVNNEFNVDDIFSQYD